MVPVMLWYVMLGSALGGGSRFLLGTFIQTRSGAVFPVGTLLINVTGSLLLGFIVRYSADSTAISPEARAFLTIGFCGGYTTFSTFTYETIRLIQDGDWSRAGWYIALSVAVSLAGAFLGMSLAHQLLELRRR
jgi:CrcB protein